MKRSARTPLQTARWLSGMSQMALANKAGLSFQRYQFIEQRYRKPTPAEQQVIAKALGAAIHDLWPSESAVSA